MRLLEHLKTVLVDASIPNVFVHRASATEHVLLRLPLEGTPVDHGMPGYYKTNVQVIVRRAKQADGDALARQLATLLTMSRRTFVEAGQPSIVVNLMTPTRLPIVYPRSEGDMIEWSLDFFCAFGVPAIY